MASVDFDSSHLIVRLTAWERALALRGPIRVPLAAIGATHVVADPVGTMPLLGLRIGFALPGIAYVGTVRGGGRWQFASIRRGQPAVEVQLSGHRFDSLLLGSDDARALATAIDAARAGGGGGA